MSSNDDPETLANWSAKTISSAETRPGGIGSTAAAPVLSLPPGETPGTRYDVGDVLGVGGMGEVRTVHDRRIGRDVALKVLRPEVAVDPTMIARFVREARIQGCLEHPTFVPVHDLAVDAGGVPYFTMKRVHGLTLTEVLARLGQGDEELAARFTRHRLLTVFSSVCLAVDFAHARGVVHRDLKPDNIMLGEHGEVYVLDWGVARLRDDSETAAGQAPSESVTTQVGAIVGTPGYMAPEQAMGDPARIGPRSDVYALGAILFELLTLKPLHEAANASGLISSTLRGVNARTGARAPEALVPPELEAICVDATALRSEDRIASAKQLSDRVERYLEGDRDEQRRRALSEELVEQARQEMARAAAHGDGTDFTARKLALRTVARALALNPDNALAQRALLDLLVTPPERTPQEVEKKIDGIVQKERRRGARLSLISNGIWLLFVPLAWMMGVRSWAMAVTSIALSAASVAVSFAFLRFARLTPGHVMFLLVLNLLAIGSFSAFFGPFFFVPTVALANLVGFTLLARRSHSLLLASLGAATTVVPFALEVIGLLPPSLTSTSEGLLLRARMVSFAPGATTVFLLLTTLAIGPLAIYIAEGVRKSLADSERRHLVQAWQLRQMVPDEALKDLEVRPTFSPPTGRP